MHILEKCTQDWFSVASTLEHLFQTIKEEKPELERVFVRSDNAGCYHNAPLILSLPGIAKRSKMQIIRYDFSEAQGGKDACDRKIAQMKAHIRRYLNEGHNVTTGHEIKAALDSYGGVSGVKVAVVEVNPERPDIITHKWDGISQFNNFQFSNTKIVAWKAFNIGSGKKFISSFLKKVAVAQAATQIIVMAGFTECNSKTGVLKANE